MNLCVVADWPDSDTVLRLIYYCAKSSPFDAEKVDRNYSNNSEDRANNHAAVSWFAFGSTK